jgi:UDP:flavonoid glycosyltransferase YjiC (YdhE family)
MLLAGVPLLVCPEQLEQTLLAFRLNQRGLCEWLSPWSDPGQVVERLDGLVSSADLAGHVASFAGKYAGYDPAATVKAVTRACLEAAA